jgi:uncharacterized protein YcaQ
MPAPLAVSQRGVRRFLLDALDLDHDGAYHPGATTPVHVLREIRRLEVVQLDPVAAVERNQHLALANRLRGYRPAMLEALLERRRIFEYWANAACVIPIEDFWMFAGVRERMRRADARERAVLRGPGTRVLRELERNGPMPSRAFLEGRRTTGYWDIAGPKTKETSHALNVLWYRGEVMVVRRDGVERYFDLPERVVPAEVWRHAQTVSVADADTALLGKYLRAYRIFDLGDFRFGWRKIPAPQRRALAEELVRRGEIIPLQIPEVRRQYYALARDLPALRRHDRQARAARGWIDRPVRFLSPLDNLLWRRERLADLFGFAYVWEIYVPAARRKFGYYTMPILAGDRLIGRMDPRLDRVNRRLHARLFNFEVGVRVTAALRRSVMTALERFAAFHGGAELSVRWPGSRRPGL